MSKKSYIKDQFAYVVRPTGHSSQPIDVNEKTASLLSVLSILTDRRGANIFDVFRIRGQSFYIRSSNSVLLLEFQGAGNAKLFETTPWRSSEAETTETEFKTRPGDECPELLQRIAVWAFRETPEGVLESANELLQNPDRLAEQSGLRPAPEGPV